MPRIHAGNNHTEELHMKNLSIALCCATLVLSSLAHAQKKEAPPPPTPKQKEERALMQKCMDEAHKQRIRDKDQMKSFMAACNR
jgi:hypothetical protein